MVVQVALTFDDGYLDQYILAKFLCSLDINATFFVITNLQINNGKSLLSSKPTLIQAIHDMGHEIGSHTCTHPNLTLITPLQAEKEIAESKKWLEKLIHADVGGFAYPLGVYDDFTVSMVSKHYRYARGTGNYEDRWNNVFNNNYKIGAMGIRHLSKLPLKRLCKTDVKLVIMLHNESQKMLKQMLWYLKIFKANFISLGELIEK